MFYSWTIIFENGLKEKMCWKYYDNIILFVVVLALRFIVWLQFPSDVSFPAVLQNSFLKSF